MSRILKADTFTPHVIRRHPSLRLLDVIHGDESLSLVFEFLDLDLKRYMDTAAIAAANLAASSSNNNALGHAGGLDANGQWVPQAQMQPLPHNVVGRGRSKRALPPDLVMVRVSDKGSLPFSLCIGNENGLMYRKRKRTDPNRLFFPAVPQLPRSRNSWPSCSSDSRTCTLVASCIAT